MKFNERLRQVMAERGVTVAAVAEALGVREATVHEWRRGDDTGYTPSGPLLGKLCAVLGWDLEDATRHAWGWEWPE